MSPGIWTKAGFSLALSLLLSLALAACQTTGGGCPPLVAYSAAQQQQAARELRALASDAQLGKMIADYKKTRDACRIGAGAQR